MINPVEELLILKTLIKGYESSISNADWELAFQVAIDIEESAEKLTSLTQSKANGD